MKARRGCFFLASIIALALLGCEGVVAAQEEASSENRESRVKVVAPPGASAARLDGKTFPIGPWLYRAPTPDSGPAYRAFGVGMFAASAGDALSTEWGLGRPRVREGNRLASNRAVRVTLHAVAPALLWYGTEKIRQEGHPRLALWTRIGMTAAYGWVTVHNLRLATSR